MDYDAIPIRRSYERAVTGPLACLDGAEVTLLRRLRYGSRNYPLFFAQYPAASSSAHPTVLLSAGVHGDEPAGVYAVMDFLEQEVWRYADRARLCIFPCANPSGFEADTRCTMNGVDLNRSFGVGSTQPEVVAIEEWLRETAGPFCLHVDLHENNPAALVEDAAEDGEYPRACYLYEWMHDQRRRIGRRLIDALPYWAPVCLLPTIEQEENNRGVIAYPEALRNAKYARGPLDALAMQHWTDHTIVTETPAIWSMEKRIAVQRLWIKRALEMVLPSPCRRGRE